MKKKIINLLYITIGSILVALSLNLFFVKLKIAPGGVSGLATVIYYLTDISVGTVIIALNIPLFLMGILDFGKGFLLKTFYATALMSFVVDYTTFLPQLTEDMLLASIFGGILMGVGLALVFKGEATTGGTDILAKVVNKHFKAFNISEQLFVIDACVVITAMITFRDFDIGFYSIIAILLSAKSIDIVLEGVGFSKAIFIISDSGEEIAKGIMEEVGRGVTGLSGEGMYTQVNKKVLLTVADRRQIPKIKEISKKFDNKSFIIVTDVREALGEGFKTEKN
ncbi:MAG: YitT family protein [Clostridiales bacterium]|nr:YitT family protein [Clostridiales bacterium]